MKLSSLISLLAKIKGIFISRTPFVEAGGLGSHGGSPNQGAADIRRSNDRMADGAFNPGYRFLIGVLHIILSIEDLLI